MDIKKIIKEEIEDFSWTEDIGPWNVLDNRFGISVNGDEINVDGNAVTIYKKLHKLDGWDLYKLLDPSYSWKDRLLRFGKKSHVESVKEWRDSRLDMLYKLPEIRQADMDDTLFGQFGE